ncbi:hypothetical protein PV08_06968 [Exophiala spinifera]|uniref:Uncharacterized protein n=1 Tax=Exophiala spinifera TaxID=91928 RepID=A0A0D1ZMY2_9EURO|nr:uncharacterized protein PV08_06968 [Exophiala spinifera]KIW14187.1 hypothetical protein PV08_06968 [Exophiala spinifera]
MTLFDCFSSQKTGGAPGSHERPDGVEREMQIMYQQPHLVPPMKLTVFDELPPTPPPQVPSQLSQWVAQGKASLRWSLSVRKHTTRPPVSRPLPLMTTNQLPFRRTGPEFRPIELSIHSPDNRLSDLPRFDRLSFTESGEIKLPPRALLRTQSEHLVPSKISLSPAIVKPASMIEQRRLWSMRPQTSSTVISHSRPPSEHDALHSHPVSMVSLPGLPPPVHGADRLEHPSVAILTPMQEEFSPPATSVTIDGVSLGFPKDVDLQETLARRRHDVPQPEGAPAPIVPTALMRNFSKPTETDSPETYFHPNYHTQKRISHWLAHNTSASMDTTRSSTTTTSSFAEHRRRRAQFYQLSAAPPRDLSMVPVPQKPERTMTQSTVVSNAETDMLSSEYQNRTDTSMTTVESPGPIGLVKSISKTTETVANGVSDVLPSPADAEAVDGADDGRVVIEEIGGPLRSPGVGVAF